MNSATVNTRLPEKSNIFFPLPLAHCRLNFSLKLERVEFNSDNEFVRILHLNDRKDFENCSRMGQQINARHLWEM
jgi:hypothetical protein